jgi:hypothetical protein
VNAFRVTPATPRERNSRRNNPDRSQHPRCVFLQRNLISRKRRGINISGVDFWHAVEFSRNGRFLQTRHRALRALPFGDSNRTRSDFRSVPGTDFLFRPPGWRGVPPRGAAGLFPCPPFRRGHHVSRFPLRLIIEPFGPNFGTPKSSPQGIVQSGLPPVRLEWLPTEPADSATTRRTLRIRTAGVNLRQSRSNRRPPESG